ncbi:MAG: hypothetical protein HQ508_01785 [Candidatus Marinimicrobia bacterium]|nr:hypothetical protein [Candidatus Neomarinimicrobiota bacterium]
MKRYRTKDGLALGPQISAAFSKLKFSPEIETAFINDYYNGTILRTRIAIFVGLVVYETFHILDYLVVPDVKTAMMWIRFGIVGPMIVIVFLLTFDKRFKRYNQFFNSIGILVSGGGIVVMTLISPHYTSSYYAGIIIVLIYCYMIMGLRFYWASGAGNIVVISYVIAMELFTDLPISITINNYFFLFGADVMLMFGAYFTEILRRRDFQLRYQLDQERRKTESLNADLEVRILERTAELELEITERKYAQQATQKALREREILLKEVYHRTKNNMNVVISLLNLQSAEQQKHPAEDVFKQLSGRIYSMSLVHEQLYRSEDLVTIRLDDYLPKLVAQLKYSFMYVEGLIQLNFNCEPVEIGLDRAVPLGLALNEIITNAFKHSFPDGMHGTIDFSIRKHKSGNIEIRIRNDGVGLPEGFNFENPETLGLRLIQLLIVEQLDGKFHVDTSDGVVYTIELPQITE